MNLNLNRNSGIAYTSVIYLKPGKAFCRINKGYFETAFRKLLGDKLKKVEINFLHDDPENNVCVEEIVFYPNLETL